MSVEGQATIDTCELDREDLVVARSKRFKELDRVIKLAIGHGLFADLNAELSPCHGPDTWYSHAAKNYIDERTPVAIVEMADEMMARFEAARAAAEQSTALSGSARASSNSRSRIVRLDVVRVWERGPFAYGHVVPGPPASPMTAVETVGSVLDLAAAAG